MANTGNLSDVISLGVSIGQVETASAKFDTVAILIVNNTWGAAQSNGRTNRYSDTATVSADANLTSTEKGVINACITDLNNLRGGKDVLVCALLTADSSSVSTAMDAVRTLDDEWHAVGGAALSDAQLQSLAAWVETSDSNQDGGKVCVVSHEASGVGSAAYVSGSANISAAVKTNLYERTAVGWDPAATWANGLMAAYFLGRYYSFDFNQKAPPGVFLKNTGGRGTFTTTQQTNAMTYTGTFVAGNIHGAGGTTAGQFHPLFVGQGSAWETIVAADYLWEMATTDLAVAVTRAASRGDRAFAHSDKGFAAAAAVVNGAIDKCQRIGWVLPDVQPDEAGENGKKSTCTYTKYADLSASDLSNLRIPLTVQIYTGPSARYITGTIYADQ